VLKHLFSEQQKSFFAPRRIKYLESDEILNNAKVSAIPQHVRRHRAPQGVRMYTAKTGPRCKTEPMA
jgi:hypothetical protein